MQTRSQTRKGIQVQSKQCQCGKWTDIPNARVCRNCVSMSLDHCFICQNLLLTNSRNKGYFDDDDDDKSVPSNQRVWLIQVQDNDHILIPQTWALRCPRERNMKR